MLRTASKNIHHSVKRKTLVEKLWATFEHFASAFNGFVDENGKITCSIEHRLVEKEEFEAMEPPKSRSAPRPLSRGARTTLDREDKWG